MIQMWLYFRSVRRFMMSATCGLTSISSAVNVVACLRLCIALLLLSTITNPQSTPGWFSPSLLLQLTTNVDEYKRTPLICKLIYSSPCLTFTMQVSRIQPNAEASIGLVAQCTSHVSVLTELCLAVWLAKLALWSVFFLRIINSFIAVAELAMVMLTTIISLF